MWTASRWVAVSVLSAAACWRKLCTLALWVAPCAAIASVASMIVFRSARWRARIPIALRTAASVGLARSRMSFRSLPRPEVPMPSSSVSTMKRCRVGRLKMLNRSRRLTGSAVWVTGTVGGWPREPDSAGLLALPGSQST